jgi:peptidoglycan/LPS O-acetylase OafA/YrhL
MRRSYLGLDLVRFFAASLVMFFHFGFPWGPLNAGPVAMGWVGVEIFFVLSGFVIAFSASNKSAMQFIVGRCARLYPAVWICATATFLIAEKPLGDYLRAMTLSPVGPWVSRVYWTLAIEISFYALVALLLATVGPRHLLKLGLGLGLWSSAFWLFRLGGALAGGHFKALGWTLFHSSWSDAALVPWGSYFGLGVMLWSAALQRWTRTTALVAAICVVGGVLHISAECRHFALAPGAASIANQSAVFVWLFALGLIYASIRWNDALWRRLGNRASVIRLIGLATYPVYLLHAEIGGRILLAALRLGVWTAFWLASVAIVSAAFAVVHLEQYPRKLIYRIAALRTGNKPDRATLP